MTRRIRAIVVGMLVFAALAAFNIVALGLDTKYSDWRLQTKLDSHDYKVANGKWDRVGSPDGQRLNTIHMALLRTGKVLMIAGSGNNRDHFEAGTFQVGLFDPATDRTTLIPAPDDLFCAGQAFLHDGRLLFGGGTERYEVLAPDVTNAAGVMTVRNESPDGGPFVLPAGTEFVSDAGHRYRSADNVEIEAADKVARPDGGTVVTASTAEVWVEADDPGDASVVPEPAQYSISGLSAGRGRDVFGLADKITRDKQEFEGARFAYELDPATESFARVEDMNEARWYPSLVTLPDGRVLTVSGLDQFGRILPGENEVYDPAARAWSRLPKRRAFPTYPALFVTPAPDTLLYTGSSAGYGPAEVGRTPGLWNWRTNAFTPVPGLRRPGETETSGSLLLPPANRQRYMILGGGGVGESDDSTGRTDIVDLSSDHPRFAPGPSLPEPTRYPNAVILPDDTVLVTGGSRRYRGTGDSELLVASLLDRSGRGLTRVADPTVGRTYHSSALLLPDGRVLTAGGDPLYDRTGQNPGTFETRIEVYSPPYLFTGGPRPIVTDGPTRIARGATVTFDTPQAADIATARLVRPSAVTHTTDLEQRSVALGLTAGDGTVDLTIPANAGVVPPGWYMLFLTNAAGVPSEARWVHVS